MPRTKERAKRHAYEGLKATLAKEQAGARKAAASGTPPPPPPSTAHSAQGSPHAILTSLIPKKSRYSEPAVSTVAPPVVLDKGKTTAATHHTSGILLHRLHS